MTPAPPAGPRIALLGCALAATAALALSGCGDSGAATAESAATAQPRAPSRSSAKGSDTVAHCPRQVDAFVDSLDALRRQLAVGLSYEQYAAKVKNLRNHYDSLPIKRLNIGCVTATGTSIETTLNKYIDAANAWSDCLADPSCTTARIEPILQRKWRLASRLLFEAQ
jgi:hypothetical protein